MWRSGWHDRIVEFISRAEMRRVKPNTHRRRWRDSTVELSRVGGVYWALVICDYPSRAA